MARQTTSKEKKGFKALFTVETEYEGVKLVAQGTWANDDKDSSLYGFINLIVDDFVAIKCSVMNGEKGAFIAFPSNKKDGKYYSQIVPMSKEVAQAINDIAEHCAEEFDK